MRELIIAPVLAAMARAITLVEITVENEATRLTAIAELKVMKKRLEEVRALLAHENVGVE
jgi:hypothetical protein